MRATPGFNKPRPYATPKGVVARAVTEAGGPKAVAARLAKRLSAVYAHTDPDDPREMSFAAVARLVTAGARAPVEYLAQLAGGVFVPTTAPAEPLAQLAAREAHEHGQFSGALLLALADGTVTAKEADTLRAEIDDTVRALLAVRARLP